MSRGRHYWYDCDPFLVLANIDHPLQYYFIDARKWFTGPKITLDVSEVSETQEKAIKEEGLDVNITGTDTTPEEQEIIVDKDKTAGV